MTKKIAKHTSTALSTLAGVFAKANKLFAGEVEIPQELKK